MVVDFNSERNNMNISVEFWLMNIDSRLVAIVSATYNL